MTTVYYNFPSLPISLKGISPPSSSKQIQLPVIAQPITNIQIDDINYVAKALYIASSNSSTSTAHLIVECYADINDNTANVVYIAIPLRVSSGEDGKSDVNKIIDSSGGETVVLTLNDYIKQGGKCFVAPRIERYQTITLESAIPIAAHVGNVFYDVTKITNLTINSNPDNNNAVLQQQDLDWIMSCELLTEDGPTEKNAVDPGTTATTISLFTMSILIAGATYISTPTLYKELGMYEFAEQKLQGNHYSVNVFWGVNLIALAFLCFGNGMKTKETFYYFIAIALVLSFFSAKSAILKMNGIANSNGTGFANTDSALRVYSEIFSRSCSTKTGLILKGVAFILFAISFLTVGSSISFGSNSVFLTFLFLFLLSSVGLLEAIRRFNI
jgi:hypothetical protein